MEDHDLIGGREARTIVMSPYDPAWAERFRAERDRIRAALGPAALRVDHIGSTSVPGLAAKPIIDIDVSVADIRRVGDFLPALLAAGYDHRVRQPEHHMVRSPGRDVHVHLCGTGSDWERRHVLFRDWLRADADDRALYARTKEHLARRPWADMNDYAAAKTPVIAEITVRAEAWAARTGWSVLGAA